MSRKRKAIRVTAVVGVLFVLGALAAELGARIVFGFSLDGPIAMLDKDCEYLPVPGEYSGTVYINPHSMRSAAVPATKPPGEFRVIVLGDSVTHGGDRIAQNEIAPNLAEAMLNQDNAASDARTFRILNCSVGSWSAVNQNGYLKKFGTFDADAIILVWNSADATDGFGNPTVSLRQPRIGLERVWGEVRSWWSTRQKQGSVFNDPGGFFAEANADAFEKIIRRVRDDGITITTIWHAERNEIDHGYREDQASTLLAVAEAEGIEVIPDAEKLRTALEAGEEPLADFIHLSASGHRVLAKMIAEQTALLAARGTP